MFALRGQSTRRKPKMSNNEMVRAVLNFALTPIYAAILLRYEMQFGRRTGYDVRMWF